jgi:hypothetical protein
VTQSNEDRAALIKKLLNKAEARGTTPAEAEAFNAKAAKLMVQWGIDDALIANADRVGVEQIIQREIYVKVPKSYSYEYTSIGYLVGEALGAKALFQKKQDGRTVLLVVGFESDISRIEVLYTSLALQCTMRLGVEFASWVNAQWVQPSGTEKFNWKRSFIRGFADGAGRKVRLAFREAVQQHSESRATEIVLVDRAAQIKKWVADNMQTGVNRKRRYDTDGAVSGLAAGSRANIGTTEVGHTRKALEG